MKLLSAATLLLASLASFVPSVSAVRLIQSNSLIPCRDNSNFTASLFNVLFTPDNNTLAVELVGVSSIAGEISAKMELFAYGFKAIELEIDPCDPALDLGGLCPMSTGPIELETNFLDLSPDLINQVPGVAYNVPDLDLTARVYINRRDNGAPIACLEARLSNGNTVYQVAVAWIVAIIAGLGLVASAVTSGLGHSNTAAHVAANALSLFGFFQAQAMIGMSSVSLPPIVQSWTQNFQWSMGIIRIGFLQRLCTWYQRATGGTPTSVLSSLATTSVQVQKRSLDTVVGLVRRGASQIAKRTNNADGVAESIRTTTVRGIERVGFRAGIESTNIFMTGFLLYVFFVGLVMLLVAAFKGYCELASKRGWMKGDKFQDFRNGWKIVMRGILFRLTLIGYPQMCILCLWELTRRDSAAEAVLAAFMIIAMTGSLGFAAWKVIALARKSVVMHQNPAYILYSDPAALNKWGFLYVQYRASAYYCVVPILAYILVKSMFIGLAQPAPLPQAIGLLVVDLALLVGACFLRPWMDKKTNVFNIAIAAINFLNVILLLFFTQVFKQPGLVTGIMGVAFFIINAAFALILLLLVLIASIYAIVSKNPETRYQPMRDDRGSFIKSQTQLTTELDALGATARGDQKRDFDDDASSISLSRPPTQPGIAVTHSNASHSNLSRQGGPPHSPIDPSVPLFPASDGYQQHPQHRGPPPGMNGGGGYDARRVYGGNGTNSPVPRNYSPAPFPRSGSVNSASSHQHPGQFRAHNNASPWQRGAGYDH